MKFDWKRMTPPKTFLNKILENITLRKQIIIKFSLSLAILLLASFLIEYFVFGYKLNVLERNNREVLILQKDKVETDSFSIDENGDYVSMRAGSSLTIPVNNQYINNLELEISKNTSDIIIASYLDSETGKVKVVENRLQKNILKNELDFMTFFVFHIDDNPENIKIEVQQPGVHISTIKFDNKYYFNQFRFIFVFAIEFFISLLYLSRKRIGENPEYGFLIVALVCGTLLVFSETRSFLSWDERVHYKNADSLTLKGIMPKTIEDIYSQTNSVPHSYSIREQKSINEFFDNRIKSGLAKSKKDNELTFPIKEFYNKLGYFPSAAALTTGRILHLPSHVIFILGRLANLLAYSAIIFIAIRKLKSGKMLLAVIALFPTAIFLASNYSYDFWVTSLTMLGFAYLFTELQQPTKKISKKDTLIMLGAFLAGLGPKAIYFPLMLLLFLLKPAKFESKKDYKKFIWASALSILIVVGSFVLPFIISGEGGGDDRGSKAVNSAEQVKFILTEPATYAKILSNFMIDYLNPKNAGGLVTSFAYLGSINGFALLMAVLIFVAVTDKNKFDKETSNLKVKALMAGIFLGTVALICTALYVAFTAVRSEIIAGVQPRYLMPLIFPLLYVLGSSQIKNPIKKNIYSMVIFGIMAAVIFGGIWNLIIKSYY